MKQVTLQRWLVVLVVVELVTASTIVVGRLARRVEVQADQAARLPNLELIDAPAAAEIRQLQQRLVVGSPESSDSWLELADVYLAFGFPREAVRVYRHACELDPGSYEILDHWAMTLERMGRNVAAIGMLRRAVRLAGQGQREQCWYRIGRCYLRQEQPDRAEDAFLMAGRFAPAVYQLAKLRIRWDRIEQALPLLQGLLEQYPDSIKVNQLGSRMERARNDLHAASRYAERANRGQSTLDLDPTYGRLEATRLRYGTTRQFQKAKEMFAAGQQNEALQRLHETIATEWREKYIHPTAAIEVTIGDASEDPDRKRVHAENAQRLLEAQIERSGATPKILEPLGAALWLKGDRQRAHQVWQRSAGMRSTRNVHLKLRQSYIERGETGRARTHGAMAHQAAGMEAFWDSRFADAEELLRSATALDATLVQAWFYLGETYRALHHLQQARQAYDKCLQLDPNHTAAGNARFLAISSEE